MVFSLDLPGKHETENLHFTFMPLQNNACFFFFVAK
jgi:hypothetical protein